ncbi:MAG: hypothetical protein ABSD38_37805 [Syntrophorhabdales bacterium]|jgi:hypothetical protein
MLLLENLITGDEWEAQEQLSGSSMPRKVLILMETNAGDATRGPDEYVAQSHVADTEDIQAKDDSLPWLQWAQEKSMKTKAGLWIDHRKAKIVTVTDNGEEMGLIVSKVEKQPRRSGDSPLKGSYEPHQVPAQDSLQRTRTEHLNIYYDAVVASVRDAESILIFGPGEAKGELKERLEKNGLGGRIVGIETADKMTDRQIAAKVRRHFPK